MYEQHFGLTKRPFSVKATGKEVFVGPQTAKTMAGFRKALVAQDAVVTVSGGVGTGKTTLVERALDAIGSKYKTIRVGRIQMNASDVLESLLIVLGVKDRPSGTIQRFTALRKKLQELQDAGTRVFILVEDALRAGADTLAELEALTVADAGESDGASIVLMGDERLFEFMKGPQLGQLQQRIRQRHRIQPLCEAELRGYLKHCLRQAGGDFDAIFDSRCAELLHVLSDGIPRVANNVADAVLVAAATQGKSKVSAKMVASVASDEFGLTAEDFDFSVPAEGSDAVRDDAARNDATPAVEMKAEPVPAVSPVPDVSPLPDVSIDTEPRPDAALREPLPEPVSASIEETEAPSEPAIPLADDSAKPFDDSAEIPHLIQDTLPDLAILSQRYATLDESSGDETQPEATDLKSNDEADVIPELTPESATISARQTPEPQPEAPDTDIPELVAEPSPAVDPKWELAKEPEFELVTGVMPALNAKETAEPDAGSEAIVDDIPKLHAEPAADPIDDDIMELALEPEPEATAAVAEIPELEIEEPVPAAAVAAETDAPAEAKPANAGKVEPELLPDSGQEETPEWDREPTLAELKPDLAALEQAMAFTHGEPLAQPKAAAKQPEELAEIVADADEIPEIILDESIETGIENLDIEEPSDILPPAPANKPDPELDRIAADIANAKSLEDIDDIMAETLFGTGISMIAAQIAANPPKGASANDELELVQEAPIAPAPAVEEKPAPAANQNTAPRRSEISEEISIETRPPVANTGIDLSASQRLKTVRALNADLPSLQEPQNDPRASKSKKAKAAATAPEPIEDQINTSITQTLKALKVPQDALDDSPEEEPKKGFLSRFRRS